MNPADRAHIDAVLASHLNTTLVVDDDTRALRHETIDHTEHCDFCFASPVTSQYAAHDFELDLPPDRDGKPTVYRSRGGWGACAFCAECIDLDARDRLLKRAFDERVGAFDDITPPHLREQVRGQQRRNHSRIQRAFWKARL
jgi:hypothetical protein